MWCNLLNGCIVAFSALVLSAFVHVDSSDKTGWHEADWVDYIAREEFGIGELDGAVEVSLFNGKRADVIWETYAIEVDWASKAPEGIGQCLYYAAVTHKDPALILLVKDRAKDVKYVEQALVVCRSNVPRIRLWAYDITTEKFLRVSDEPR